MALRTPPGPSSSSLSNRSIPPLLEPCLALPPAAGALALLTSVLGAGANWLVLRYLTAYLLGHHHQLPPRQQHRQADDGEEEEAGGEQRQQDVRVVLVSFMRDYAFWRDGAGRLGLDLEAQSRKSRFRFIDGLTGLFLDGGGAAVAKGNQTSSSSSSTSAAVLSASSGLQGIGRTIHAAVDELLASSGAGGGQPKVVLIIDQPDLLLAATAGDESALRQGSAVTSGGLQDLLLELREKVYSCLVTASADEPLVSSQSTTLEKEHAAFVLAVAHQAETVLSLRLLDTGTANDVSGVVRITHGGDDAGEKVPGVEYLYHVGSDGGVRVFGRGQ